MLPMSNEGLLTTAAQLMKSIETAGAGVALYRAYLSAPEDARTEEGTHTAECALAEITSGVWAERRKRAIRREQLHAEAYAVLGEFGHVFEEAKARRRERTAWRREMANNVLIWIKEGKTEAEMRQLAGGVSGFTIQRAYARLKRLAGDPGMSNADLRQYIRTGTRRRRESAA